MCNEHTIENNIHYLAGMMCGLHVRAHADARRYSPFWIGAQFNLFFSSYSLNYRKAIERCFTNHR